MGVGVGEGKVLGHNFDMTTKLTRRSNILHKDFLSSGYTCTDAGNFAKRFHVPVD